MMEEARPSPAAASTTALPSSATAAAASDLVVPGVGVLPGVPTTPFDPRLMRSAGPAVLPPTPGGAFQPLVTKSSAALVDTQGRFGLQSYGGAYAAEVHAARIDREKAAMGKSTGSAADVKQQVEPKTVPSFPWEFAGPTVDFDNCTAQAAGVAMLKALRAARVDFTFNPAKFKAKCWVYEREGFCFFISRLYTRSSAAGFVAELQLRDGSRGLFGRKHSDVLRALVDDAAQGGGAFAIPVRCEAARQARLLGFLPPLDAEEASRIASAAAERVAATVPDGVPPELSLNSLPPPPVSLGAAPVTTPGAGAAAQAVDESVAAVVALLRAQYDDVAVAGAEAALGIAESPTARAALGARITSVSPPCHALAALIEILVIRASGKNNDSARCRTLCAFALEGLAGDASLARAMLIKYAAALLDAVSFDPHGAADLFALRRAAVHTVRSIAEHSVALAAALVAQGCARQLEALSAPAYAGVDPAFDAAVLSAVSKLQDGRQ